MVCVLDADLDRVMVELGALQERRPITVPDPDIVRVSVERDGVRLETREQDEGESWSWSLGTRSGETDEGSLSDWLSEIRAADAIDIRPLDEAQLAGFGLDAPRAVLEVEGRDEVPDQILELGAAAVEGVYARRRGEDALLVLPAAIDAVVEPDPLRLRPVRLARAEAADLAQLTVSRGGTEERLGLEEGVWRVLAPIEAPADRVLIRDLADRLATLEALRWVSEEPAPEHGLASPRAVATARFEPGGDEHDHDHGESDEEDEEEPTELTVRIGADTDGGAYAQLGDDPAVFVVVDTLARRLITPLVDRSVIATPRIEIETLALTRGGTTVEMTYDGRTLTGPAGPVDAERGAQLVDRLDTLQAERTTAYGTVAGDGMDAPRIRLVLGRAAESEGPRERVLLVGAAEDVDGDSLVHVRRADLDVGFLVPAEAVEPFFAFEP